MKKSELIKMIKKEIVDVIKERDYSEPVETGAFANLQTSLKSGDPKKIEKAIELVKDSGNAQGVAAAMVAFLGTFLAGSLSFPGGFLSKPASYSNTGTAIGQAVEQMTTRAAINHFNALSPGLQRTIYELAFKAFKNNKGGEGLRNFVRHASAIVNKAK